MCNSKQNPALLVLAAGLGSRYGGCKQIESVGPDNNEIILDYSLYDAWQCGFQRAVLVVRPGVEEWLRDVLQPRWQARVSLHFVEQKLDDLPAGIDLSRLAPREKPWGTGHAVWSARQSLREPFMAVNADDFYGRETFRLLADFLRREGNDGESPLYALAGYRLAATLSPHGSVARGICEVDENTGYLLGIREQTGISLDPDGRPSVTGEEETRYLEPGTCVSLNAWAFTPSFLSRLEERLAAFLGRCGDEPKTEFYLPSAVGELMEQGRCRVRVLPTFSPWFGMTYKQDLELVRGQIKKLIEQGVYPAEL